MKKNLLILIISFILIFQQSNVILASNTEILLEPYINRLEQLNELYETNYEFVSFNDLSESERENLLSFYTHMKIEDFDKHIKEIHTKDLQLSNPTFKNHTPQLINSISSKSSSSQNVQKYHYSGNNYLKLTTNIRYIGGEYIYDKVLAYGASKNYPYYDPTLGFESTISGNRKTINCTYKCVKRLSKYINDATNYTIRVQFTAGGGDVYTAM